MPVRNTHTLLYLRRRMLANANSTYCFGEGCFKNFNSLCISLLPFRNDFKSTFPHFQWTRPQRLPHFLQLWNMGRTLFICFGDTCAPQPSNFVTQNICKKNCTYPGQQLKCWSKIQSQFLVRNILNFPIVFVTSGVPSDNVIYSIKLLNSINIRVKYMTRSSWT